MCYICNRLKYQLERRGEGNAEVRKESERLYPKTAKVCKKVEKIRELTKRRTR